MRTQKTHAKIERTGAIKSVDAGGEVVGLASTFGGSEDLQGDVVERNAFTKTVADLTARREKLPLLARHLAFGGDVKDAVGVIERLWQNDEGLWFKASILPDEESQNYRRKLAALIKKGLTPGCSIGFRVIRARPRMRQGRLVGHTLQELALKEITVTLKPANEGAHIQSVKSAGRSSKRRPANVGRHSRIRDEIKKIVNEETPAAPKPPVRERVRDMLKAQAKDHGAIERAHVKAFSDYMIGSKISGVARSAFEPTGSLAGLSGLRMPLSLAAKALGSGYGDAFGAKAILSVDDPANVSQGESLVTTEQREAIEKLAYTPAVYDLVRIILAANGSVSIGKLAQTDANEFGGVSWEWRGEDAEKPETEPEFDQDTITCHEVSGYTEVSERCLSRVPGLEAFLTAVFRSSMVALFDSRILAGSGIGQPLGVVNTAGIRLVTRATAGTVSPADVIELKHSIKPSHRGGARYVMHDDAERSLELAVDTAGLPVLPLARPSNRIAGYPYASAEACRPLGSVGDIVLGGWINYAFAQEQQIVVKRSPHALFKTNKIAIKTFAVVGGRPLHPRAFAVLEDAAS